MTLKMLIAGLILWNIGLSYLYVELRDHLTYRVNELRDRVDKIDRTRIKHLP